MIAVRVAAVRKFPQFLQKTLQCHPSLKISTDIGRDCATIQLSVSASKMPAIYAKLRQRRPVLKIYTDIGTNSKTSAPVEHASEIMVFYTRSPD
jgi:hypothetical protein